MPAPRRALTARISDRWAQFRADPQIRSASLQSLLLNLAFLRQGLRSDLHIVIFVDSWREAILLKLLSAIRTLPRFRVRVIRRTEDVPVAMSEPRSANTLVIVTSHLYARYHPLMAASRKRLDFVVV
jgi:hypothetical protein